MRSFVPFGGLWAMPIEVPYSLLVRDGDLAWSSGQVPLDGASRVLAPGDLAMQTDIVCDYIEEVLRRGALPANAIGKLVLYYVPREDGDRGRMLAHCRARFGDRPVLVPIAVPHFYYDGLLLEVDVFASARQGRVIETSNDTASVHILDGGELAWAAVSLAANHAANHAVNHLAEAERLLEATLHELDLQTGDRMSEHWVAPIGDAGGTHVATLAKTLREMRLISDEGTLVKGAEGHGALVGELTYARGPSKARSVSSRDLSDVRVATRRRGRFDWVSARCLDGSLGLVDQTSRLMAVIDRTLRELGITFENIVKSTSHYVGGSSPDELHDNMTVRNRYYERPGPASTGLPVFGLADDDSRIAVDLLAARRA